MKQNPIAREEWDFSGIPEAMVEMAATYEALRSSQFAIRAAEEFRKRGGITLEKLKRSKDPFSLIDKVPPLYEDGAIVVSVFEQFVRENPLFPIPWTQLDIELDKNFVEPRFRSVRLRELNPALANVVNMLLDSSSSPTLMRYLATVDLTRPVNELVSDFKEAIQKEKRRLKVKEPRGTGSESVKRLSRSPLKWISAMRLNNAGMTHPQAMSFLKSEQKARERQCGGIPEAWPFFEAPSKWSIAVKKGKQFVCDAESGFYLITDKE